VNAGNRARRHLERDSGAGELGAQNKRKLWLNPRRDELIDSNGIAVVVDHVSKEVAEIGRIDAQLLLHGERREADLATGENASRSKVRLLLNELDAIRVVNRHIGKALLERGNGNTRFPGFEEFVS